MLNAKKLKLELKNADVSTDLNAPIRLTKFLHLAQYH